MAAPPGVAATENVSAGTPGPGSAAPSGSGPVSAGEMHRLCEPILSGHQAVERALREERRYLFQLGGVLAVAVVAISLVTGWRGGPVPASTLLTAVGLLAVASLPIVLPEPTRRLAEYLIGRPASRAAPDSAPTSILYRSVKSVHDARASTERLWIAVMVLGVLLSLFTAAVAGIGTLLVSVAILRDWSPGYVGVSLLLAVGVATGAVLGVVVSFGRRLARIEELQAAIGVRLAWLERLEAALWARY